MVMVGSKRGRAGGVRSAARLAVVVALAVSGVVVVWSAPPSEAAPALYLPYAGGTSHRVTQGNGGAFSHSGTYGTYAIDFQMDPNTGVVASAAGTIVSVRGGCAGLTRNDSCNGGLGNTLVVQHEAGFCTQYAHLNTFVRTSGSVARGELIARSGNSGWSTGPHLDFRRTACNTVSQPFKFVEYSGSYADTSITGRVLTSQNVGAQANANPFGHFDVVSSPSPGQIRVRGWAADPNVPTLPINVHVYIGGRAGAAGARNLKSVTANGRRDDVARVHPQLGAFHGFDATINADRSGTVPICIHAINQGPGSNVLLGCRDVQIANPNPIGNFEAVSSPTPGQLRVQGWTADPNVPTSPINVHVYIGGRAGAPGARLLQGVVADRRRDDVARVHPHLGASHGFDATIAADRSGTVPVCVHAINQGPGGNVLLGCRNVTIAEVVK